jgi:hypothetical protein
LLFLGSEKIKFSLTNKKYKLIIYLISSTFFFAIMTWICGGKSMQGRRRVQEDKYIIIEDLNAFSVKTLEKPNVRLPSHLMPGWFIRS